MTQDEKDFKEILHQTDTDRILALIDSYYKMSHLYNSAIKHIVTKLEILDDEFHTAHNHNPIHHIESRLKTPQSLFSKLRRRNLALDLDVAREEISDIAGVRVVCFYTEDIYTVSDLLLAQEDVRLVRKSDYIQAPKESGYRSLHLILDVPVYRSDRAVSVPVEVQIRTVAMDFWASLEHQILYKNNSMSPEKFRLQLRECAEEISRLDEKMQDLYKQI